MFRSVCQNLYDYYKYRDKYFFGINSLKVEIFTKEQTKIN